MEVRRRQARAGSLRSLRKGHIPQGPAAEHSVVEQPLKRLASALAAQRDYLKAYEQQSEPVVYETLRTLDDLFCRDLMERERQVPQNERRFPTLSTWGVNHALQRIVPRTLPVGLFRNFPSREPIQAQADDFVFNCGVLCLADRFEGWLRDGILSAELRPYPNSRQDRLKDINRCHNAKRQRDSNSAKLCALLF